MYKTNGILPDELARQDPVLLFVMMNSMDDSAVAPSMDDVPDDMKWFYGE